MEFNNKQMEKSRKIRELFNLDIVMPFNDKKKVNYNEEIYFKNQAPVKDKISAMISEVVNSLNERGRTTPSNRAAISLSQDYFDSNINYIVHDIKKESSGLSNPDNKFYRTKSGNNISIDNYSTISSHHKSSASKPSMEMNNNQPKTYFFVPCINCNNLIHLDDIEIHSVSCTNVKEEVIKVESSAFSYHTIDYKLKKLQEHLKKIELQIVKSNIILKKVSTEDLTKDAHYFSLMNKYIEDSLILSTININTISALKKIITNLNTFITNFKGTFSTLIFIERTRVIILEKMNIIKEDLKKIYEFKKQNPERKSGLLSLVKLKELEQKKEEIIREKSSLEIEKEFIQRKVSNLKSSVRSKTPDCSYIKDDAAIEQVLNEAKSVTEFQLEKEVSASPYKLEEINSDCERMSLKDDNSDNTSVANSSVMSDTDRNHQEIKDEVLSQIDIKYTIDPKVIYKEFVKVFLKVKFENLHSRHRGQNIQQTLVWKEALRRNIPKSQWEEFIIDELKNTQKYDKMRKTKAHNKAPVIMDTINEEN